MKVASESLNILIKPIFKETKKYISPLASNNCSFAIFVDLLTRDLLKFMLYTQIHSENINYTVKYNDL